MLQRLPVAQEVQEAQEQGRVQVEAAPVPLVSTTAMQSCYWYACR